MRSARLARIFGLEVGDLQIDDGADLLELRDEMRAAGLDEVRLVLSNPSSFLSVGVLAPDRTSAPHRLRANTVSGPTGRRPTSGGAPAPAARHRIGMLG